MNLNNTTKTVLSTDTKLALDYFSGFLSPVNPLKLVQLNFGLFGSLYSLGTSRERICAALLLSSDEYDYVIGLGGFARSE